MTLAPTTGYTIAAERPIAPSEAGKNLATRGRRAVGGAALGGLAGAIGGHALGVNPGYGAAAGAGLGLLHGTLRGEEQIKGDKVTQERMAMREAMRAAKKEKKSGRDTDVMDRARDRLARGYEGASTGVHRMAQAAKKRGASSFKHKEDGKTVLHKKWKDGKTIFKREKGHVLDEVPFSNKVPTPGGGPRLTGKNLAIGAGILGAGTLGAAYLAHKKKESSFEIDGFVLRGMRDELTKISVTMATGAHGAAAKARQAARGAVDPMAATGRHAIVPAAPATQAAAKSVAQPVTAAAKPLAKAVPKGKLTGEIAEVASKNWHKSMPKMGITGRVGQKVVGGLNRISGGVTGTALHTGAGARAMRQGAGHAAGVKGLQAIGKGALGAAGVAGVGAGALAYGAHRLLKGRRKAQPQPRVV